MKLRETKKKNVLLFYFLIIAWRCYAFKNCLKIFLFFFFISILKCINQRRSNSIFFFSRWFFFFFICSPFLMEAFPIDNTTDRQHQQKDENPHQLVCGQSPHHSTSNSLRTFDLVIIIFSAFESFLSIKILRKNLEFSNAKKFGVPKILCRKKMIQNIF